MVGNKWIITDPKILSHKCCDRQQVDYLKLEILKYLDVHQYKLIHKCCGLQQVDYYWTLQFCHKSAVVGNKWTLLNISSHKCCGLQQVD